MKKNKMAQSKRPSSAAVTEQQLHKKETADSSLVQNKTKRHKDTIIVIIEIQNVFTANSM
jgi:hypothetical protein